VGLLTIEDAETGEVLELDTARDSVREAFAEGASRRQEQLDRALMQAGVDLVRFAPEDDYASMLQRFFEHRRRR